MKLKFLLLAAGLTFAGALPASTATLDISGTEDRVWTKPLASGATLVRLSFDLTSWPAQQTFIVRHCCPPGVEMRSQGFAVLPVVSGDPIGIRQNVRLTNARNLPGDNGEECFSWYILNDGTDNGRIRLEISFLAKASQ